MINAMMAGAIVVLFMTANSVQAHHGWSGYDSMQALNLSGMIHESGYEHPHAYNKLATPEKIWLVVLAPPSRMERRGMRRDMLAVGTTAIVVGYPHRTDAVEMRAERITIDGKTVELR
jgi:hypothetical protein